MKVKNLIDRLKLLKPEMEVSINVPYLKGGYHEYDLFIIDFDLIEEDGPDGKYLSLKSNEPLYDHFDDIYVPLRSLNK